MTISENVAAVRKNMEEAALRAGRDPQDITLLAASKTQSAAAIREAFEAGVDAAGENRAQEWRDKAPFLEAVPYHFIGRLQSNKLKYLVGRTPLIHSVDSEKLLREIDVLAERRGLIQNLLCEVNLCGEENKGGVAPTGLPTLLKNAGSLANIRVCGLMCIPPMVGDKEKKNLFLKMWKLFVDIRNENMDNVHMEVLSMGMSSDYALAIECGSTLVRVGSAVFGARDIQTLGTGGVET